MLAHLVNTTKAYVISLRIFKNLILVSSSLIFIYIFFLLFIIFFI